jgi:hypothetical protein
LVKIGSIISPGENEMADSAKLYFMAAALALIAALVIVAKEGFTPDERFRVGFLIAMAAGLFWLGSRARSGSAN